MELQPSRRVRLLYSIIVVLAVVAFAGLARLDLLPSLYTTGDTPSIWVAVQLINMFIVATTALVAILAVYIISLRRAIRRQQQAEEAARKLTLFDPLTGLPNRRNFESMFEGALTEAGKKGHSVALIVLNLDRFRTINDLHGHTGGDRVLQEVARRIRKAVGPNGIIAHLSADEFAVVIGCKDRDERVVKTMQDILKEIRLPIPLGIAETKISASLGVAIWPRDGQTREIVMQRADLSMTQAKAAGRNTFATFDLAVDSSIRERLALENELPRAIEDGQIVPHYQPFIEMETSELIGFEVLARWTHPVKGPIGPDVFIPLASDTGHIDRLFERILDIAAREAMTWSKPLLISVNASPTQLRDKKMRDTVLNCLKQTGLPPQRLEIEVTEDAIVEDFERAKGTISDLKAAGIGISLDDFGTGYSSLQQLYALPVDKIKLDQTLINQRRIDSAASTIVDLVILLAHRLKLKVTAEGIESQADATWLAKRGCDIAQGYFYSRPVPASEARNIVIDGGQALVRQARAKAG
ncbi:putative bifunctional diguanylate cyclase/phosphodiesterase [Amorphus orientalis]|uniref:Diguanylate cyclase (GGDEF)-like protein n=1 Tax=Amorphus orientalis TaxID=649198 RepID=A0AAE3VN82_9HYPH|nr:EAL domain-containing protein [Amorphus orientalis]MDQ0314766.1 diguanylate cyclase (GGDEF)-like protein [Amorphus orientalis]